MKSSIKSWSSPDVEDLELYRPAKADCFGFLIELLIGSTESEGEDIFGIVVCTPDWLKDQMSKDPDSITIGRGYLFVQRYDYEKIFQAIRRLFENCESSSWEDIANRLSRIASWEFEDYKEASEPN